MSGKSVLDFELDINEIHEFQLMCTRPLVKKVLVSVVEEFGTVLHKLHYGQTTNKNWREVGRM